MLLFFCSFLFVNLVNSQGHSQIENRFSKQQRESMQIMREYYSEKNLKLSDFVPDYYFKIPIEYKGVELYYINITTTPCSLKGSFLIMEESTDTVQMMFKDEKDDVIYEAIGHYNIFNVNITQKGLYRIVFLNFKSKKELKINFSFSDGQNKIISGKDLTKTESKLENLSKLIKQFNNDFKLGHEIHTMRYQSK